MQVGISSAELERRVLHDASGLLVVDKPPGLPTSGRNLDDPDCLQHALIKRHGDMVWAVHQLDADTSGLNVFVSDKRLVAIWKDRMAFPNGRKTYQAIVHGRASFEAKRIDSPIGVVSTDPVRELGVTDGGKRAVTEVRCLARGADASLLEVQIETGRTHQIRIHLASIGHPVIGDDWYGGRESSAHPRQALHAWRLEFRDGEPNPSFECGLPEDMLGLAAQVL